MSPLEKAANAYPVANLKAVGRLLSEHKSAGTSFDHEFENDSEQTYVHLMALYGDCELLSWLVTLGCGVKNTDYNSVTALHMASCKGYVSCVEVCSVYF
jgi:ankyrin repeat protein